jgi:hypothetical protein
MVIRRKSSTSGLSKLADKPMSALKTATPMAVVAASSSTRGTDWTVLLTADAWDSSRWVTEFLESLKNREANQEGIPFVPLDASIH